VVFTNGCFDLLHPGHLDLLARAKSMGDRLIVALNSDASVAQLKGESRPIVPENDRLIMVASLLWVDMVLVFDEATPAKIIEAILPDVLVKGGDYKPEEVVGAELVQSHGGRLEIVPFLPGYSTTGLLTRIQGGRSNQD